MSLAEELRKEATIINKAFMNKDVQDIVEYIRLQAKQSAKSGNFEIRIPFQTKPWKTEALKLATDMLRDVDKFEIEYKSEVTAWYCNTDFDQEQFLYVRW